MEDLRDVVLNVLRCAGPQPVGRTVLVKLVYFAELESWQRHGRPLTRARFRRDHFGAYAPEVHEVAEAMPQFVSHKRIPGFEWAWEHKYSLMPDAGPHVPQVSPDAEEILVYVCKRYSRMSAKSLGALSKETEPVRAAEPGQPLDMASAAPHQPRVAIDSRLKAIAERQAATASSGGSDVDRRALDRELFDEMKPRRLRASAKLDVAP